MFLLDVFNSNYEVIKMSSKLTIEIKIEERTQDTIQTVCENIEAMSRLLAENKELLSQVLKGSFQVVKTPLDVR